VAGRNPFTKRVHGAWFVGDHAGHQRSVAVNDGWNVQWELSR